MYIIRIEGSENGYLITARSKSAAQPPIRPLHVYGYSQLVVLSSQDRFLKLTMTSIEPSI